MITTSGSLVVVGQVQRPDVAAARARCEGQRELAHISFLPARLRAGQPWEGLARAAPSGDDEPCSESRQRNGGGGIHRDDVDVHRLTSARRTDGSASRRPGCEPVPYRPCPWPKRWPVGGFTGHPVELHCPLASRAIGDLRAWSVVLGCLRNGRRR